MGLPSLGEIWNWLETTRRGGRGLGGGALVQRTEKRPRALLRGAQSGRNAKLTLSGPERQLVRHIGRALSSLPSSVARLVYLASLRDSYAGTYLHDGWITIAKPAEVDETLRDLHHRTFSNLFDLGLEELCRNLRAHLESVGGSVRKGAEVWLELEPYREMIPQGRSPLLRALFISQIRVALKVLVCSPDLAVLEGQAASPPRRPVPPPPLHPDN